MAFITILLVFCFDLLLKQNMLMSLLLAGKQTIKYLYLPSARQESLEPQSVRAASTDPPCAASCSSAPGSSSTQAPAESSSGVGSAAATSSQPEGTEDTSGGCRRAEPTAREEEAEEGQSQSQSQSQSQPARGNQDSDDSDDDPILIPSTRFRGQGQRYDKLLTPDFFHTGFVLHSSF